MNQETPRSESARTGSYQRRPAQREEVSSLKLMLLTGGLLVVLGVCVTLYAWH